MKSINLKEEKPNLEDVLNLAREEPILLLTAEGKEFYLSEADDFAQEVGALLNSQAFQRFLDERSAGTRTIPLINTIWQAHNLKPHRVEIFKLSRDPKFLEKLTDVVGLSLNPPKQAIVLCVDEKSQMQALDRTQPSFAQEGAVRDHDP